MSDSEPDECGIKPVTFRGWAKQACVLHDKFYVKGSWAQQNLTRKRADDHFLDMLLEESGNNVPKRVASYVMYGVVRAVGWMWWEGKR